MNRQSYLFILSLALIAWVACDCSQSDPKQFILNGHNSYMNLYEEGTVEWRHVFVVDHEFDTIAHMKGKWEGSYCHGDTLKLLIESHPYLGANASLEAVVVKDELEFVP